MMLWFKKLLWKLGLRKLRWGELFDLYFDPVDPMEFFKQADKWEEERHASPL